MKVDGRWRRTIEVVDGEVIVLDQAKLPYETTWLPLRTLNDAARAIRDMHVRGAPLKSFVFTRATGGITIAHRC